MEQTQAPISIRWNEAGEVVIVDQTKLPLQTVYEKITTPQQMYEAIQTMKIRGAGALAIGAAYGVYLGIAKKEYPSGEKLAEDFDRLCRWMSGCRPTAVSLSKTMQELSSFANSFRQEKAENLKAALLEKCHALWRYSIEKAERIGELALPFLKDGSRVLTHCNCGSYASVKWGSLAPLYLAHERGMNLQVYADETRPLLQGSRLTAHELSLAGIDVTVICDDMAAFLMQQGKIDCVMLGCDRIAANGDVVNKIGTYCVALAAQAHQIPFYVIGADADIDFSVATGAEIPIEERADCEVTDGFGRKTAPVGVKVYNPAFDITPHHLVTAIITESGVYRPSYRENLQRIREK